MQHYMIKFVSDLRQVGGFLRFLPPIKLTANDITEILLKEVLNTITLAHPCHDIAKILLRLALDTNLSTNQLKNKTFILYTNYLLSLFLMLNLLILDFA